jgi:hypothetical protein
MRFYNFKLVNKNLRKYGDGCGVIKKKSKTDFDVDLRVPINFRPLKWIITPQQTNSKADYAEINGVQNETKIIEEKS